MFEIYEFFGNNTHHLMLANFNSFLACMLHTAEVQFGDISGRTIADLGCGCGILSIGAALLHSDLCIGIDLDDGKL